MTTPQRHSHSGPGDGGESLSPEQATIGATAGAVTGIQWERPEVLKSDTTVRVPQDEPTIQDALRKVPRRLLANSTITVDEAQGPYTEDLVIPPVNSEELVSNTEGGNARLTLKTQGGTAASVDSVFGIGGRGQGNVVLANITATTTNPYDDETAAFAFYGGEFFKMSACALGGSARGLGSNGILCYASRLKIEGSFDWGTDLVAVGGRTKQQGVINVDNGVTATGSVTDHAWEAGSGRIEHNRIGPTSTNQFATDPRRTGGITSHLIPMVDRAGNLVDFVNIEADDDLGMYDVAGNPRMKFIAAGGPTTFKNASSVRLQADTPLEFEDEAGNIVTLFADAGELKVTDSTGTTTTLS